MTEEQLRAAFARFGDIIYVKIPAVRDWHTVGTLQLSARAGAQLCSSPQGLPLREYAGQRQLPTNWGNPAACLVAPHLQGKGCGFVQFVLRTAAERAMATMNGQVLGAGAMRISWGRSSSRVANQAAQQGGMAGHFGMHGECMDGQQQGLGGGSW